MRNGTLLLSAFLALCFAFQANAADPVLSFAGSGTEADPWQITSKADVMELARACNGDGTMAAKDCGHFAGKYFVLTADIDMEADTTFIGIATAPEGQVPSTLWKFQGNFDGQGHTVSNMVIHGTKFDASGKALSSSKTNSRKYCGFFGIIDGATVRNLNIDASCHVDAYGYTGAIAGQMSSKSKIENCTSKATIVSYDQFGGGIVGDANASSVANKSTITGCFNYGSVSVLNKNGGGIVGQARYTDISDCVNLGLVSMSGFNSLKANGVQQYCGGIAGIITYSVVSDCLNAGTVYMAGTYSGGITGCVGTTTAINTAKVARCASTGSLLTTDVLTAGAIAGFAKIKADTDEPVVDCVYDVQLWGSKALAGAPYKGVSGLATAVFTDGTLPAGLTADKWVTEKGFYPVMKGCNNEVARTAAATYVLFPTDQSAENFATEATVSSAMPGITATLAVGKNFTVSGDRIVVGDNPRMALDTIRLLNGAYRMEIPIVKLPKAFVGKGTKEEPYLIQGIDDLLNLAELCNGITNDHFEDAYFTLTCDLDMAGIDDFNGIAAKNNGKYNSFIQYYFSGHFDGGGHKVSNMKINAVKFDADGNVLSYGTLGGSLNNVGFFGALGTGASVENLIIDETCEVTGYYNVGAVVGHLAVGASVRNCVNGAKVRGYEYRIGGIVGHADCTTTEIASGSMTISDCINYGDVISNNETAGGIVGDSRAMISNCLNAGNVTVSHFNDCIDPKRATVKRAGGIAGSNGGNIYDCVNIGNVVCDSIYAGGIAGFNTNGMSHGLIFRSINAGQVRAKDMTTAGAFIGEDYHKVGSQDQVLFTDCLYDSQYSGAPAAQGLDAAGIAPVNTDSLVSGNAITAFEEKYTFAKGYYPLPASIADKEIARRIASTLIRMPGSQTLGNFIAPAEINTAMPLEASLSETAGFYIEEGMVKSRPVKEITQGVLTLVNGPYRRLLTLTTLPSVFEGEGTAASPYLISNIEEFKKITPFMTGSGFDFEGRFFLLTSDLDFTDSVDYTPIGTPNLYFNGSFDGNGKTIKGFRVVGADETTDIGGSAIFSGLGSKGSVINLHASAVETEANEAGGVIAGYVFGKITGCSTDTLSRVTVVPGKVINFTGGKKGLYAGGIAGYVGPTAYIADCENHATVSAHKQAGGISGGSSYESGAVIERCVNYGTVGAVAPTETEVVGGHPTQKYVDAMAGGIAGRLNGDIRRCTNYGHILATQCSSAGGILGSSYIRTNVDSCVNQGLVEVYWEFAGGIAGYGGVASQGKKGCIITACENYGNTKAMSGAGGIAGYGGNGFEVQGCANFGEINASARVGGILGRCESLVRIADSYNAGKATAAGRCASGVVGEVTLGGLIVERCFNAGEITTDGLNGITSGIVNSTTGSVSVSDCYNVGTISSAKYVGGIVGKGDQTTLSRCYNTGTIACTRENNLEKYAGNIAGDAGVKTTQCYYLNTATEFTLDKTAGEAITPAELCDSHFLLGNSFTYANACLPRLQSTENTDAARVFSAYWLLDGTDTPESVNGPIELGQPGGVEWTAQGSFHIDGDKAIPDMKGSCTLTATCGSFSRSYDFMTSEYFGVEEIEADGFTDIRWFSLSGVEIASPSKGEIVIMTATDASGHKVSRKVRF